MDSMQNEFVMQNTDGAEKPAWQKPEVISIALEQAKVGADGDNEIFGVQGS